MHSRASRFLSLSVLSVLSATPLCAAAATPAGDSGDAGDEAAKPAFERVVVTAVARPRPPSSRSHRSS